MGSLTRDPAFVATTFGVIDFETTTPAGHPAQPIEVAVLALRHEQENGWIEAGRFTSLIRPPAFAPVTSADTAQNGLRPAQFTTAPEPAEVFGALDRRFTAGTRYLLVAQHAATEAGVIRHQREHCPRLARIDFLDTIPLAKRLVPGLENYRLDTLLDHFAIPSPAERHRAHADVDVTAQVFLRLIDAADREGGFPDLAALVKVAGRTARANLPTQEHLFDL
ncbi:PolC-type DNA polymerase III [Nocardiopsis sp. MG754419]|uniref:3'-5' exonuclease n=1 Tax=Nocardiopsis sp. MG754419 TaxID=2259865 RepID=UPI001BA49CB6|nr:3'-5' exonuclease [Nocardiopsis sp. MG754419]MBR8742585.1 3'-5' exonuclease [Nocardiopsis sp. MG754419]